MRLHVFSQWMAAQFAIIVALAFACSLPMFAQDRLQTSDLSRFREVGDTAISPDGANIAYTALNFDRPGRPYPQLWVMNVASGKSVLIGALDSAASDPVWSRDSRWIAYQGEAHGKSGLCIARADGSAPTFLAEVTGTNAPIPGQGNDITWSPDGKEIAFISATPGPEAAAATGDPMVFTRYLWRPTAGEGIHPWNDNRRLHIFIVNVASKQVRQLTSGEHYEHSIDWSPDGSQILFCSDRSPYADQFFHYNIYEINPSDGSIRQLTTIESTQYHPLWSPDGKQIAFLSTKRGLTDRETTMEDTHVWLMNADGSDRRELASMIDDRQGAPVWSPASDAVYFTVQVRGSIYLEKLSVRGGRAQILLDNPGAVRAISVSNSGALAFSFSSSSDMGELFLRRGDSSKQLTRLNEGVLRGKTLGQVQSFDFTSNDNKYDVEAFLLEPVDVTPSSKHPLIVNIHGGPHGQNGPAFSFRDQIFAARGWAVLHVNYRGSTGYGQAFADAVFGDQDGNEAQDVLYGVSAAIRRYPWIDPTRMGIEGVSYGGQLTYRLITQTREFKAAIPTAGITNLISYNYLTYYNQYEQMEFGALPHQDDLMDIMWKRSALRYVAQVATPTLI